MKSVNWQEIEEHEVAQGLFGKFFHSNNMTIVRWRFNAGSDLPLHNHPHEQVTILQEGKLELTIGKEKIILESGDIIPVASEVSHGGKAIESTIAIDVFQPVREDFKEKYG